MFNISSKYFSFFNNKPPVGWAVHIARGFLTCYSCSYDSSMVWLTSLKRCILSLDTLLKKLIPNSQWMFKVAVTVLNQLLRSEINQLLRVSLHLIALNLFSFHHFVTNLFHLISNVRFKNKMLFPCRYDNFFAAGGYDLALSFTNHWSDKSTFFPFISKRIWIIL